MKIEVDTYYQIRHITAEGKSQREIAKILSISRTTVKKYSDGSTMPGDRKGTSGRRPYKVTDEVIKFIKDCLLHDENEGVKKQQHTAERIHQRLVDELNFTGGKSTIRKIVSELKEHKTNKVFIPLSFEPAEAAQIDWGEATVYLDSKKTKVNLFCMRMCYSSDIFVKAFFRQNEESFLEGIISGFEHFYGVTNKIIFDNAKVAVKEGFGLHAKVQDKYKLLSAHYCFKPEFCNIASGHEKGLVEGLVGWIRRNTLVPIPKVNNIDELNYLLIEQCKRYRNHQIQRKPLTVGELAKIDRNKLLPLPLYKFDSSKSTTIKVDEFSTVKYDYNYYSVPIEYANKSVTIKGFGNEILILYRNTMIAKYQRIYLRNETIYSLNHYINLLEKRPRSVFNAKPVKRTITKRWSIPGLIDTLKTRIIRIKKDVFIKWGTKEDLLKSIKKR